MKWKQDSLTFFPVQEQQNENPGATYMQAVAAGVAQTTGWKSERAKKKAGGNFNEQSRLFPVLFCSAVAACTHSFDLKRCRQGCPGSWRRAMEAMEAQGGIQTAIKVALSRSDVFIINDITTSNQVNQRSSCTERKGANRGL